MRIHPSTPAGDAASARAIQKAVRQHSHGTKSGEHRHERRKVREFLRHAEAAEVVAFEAIR